MKLIVKMLAVSVLSAMLSLTVQAAEKATENAKPATQDIAMITLEATVTNIDRQARKVTLKTEQGETKTFTLKKDAGKLDAVEVGDLLTIKYIKAVTIQVFAADEVQPVADADIVVAKTEPGEKPAALAAAELSIVVTIDSIDLTNELVTLKGEDGKLETVKVRYPENLKKVKVGDQVKITYTEAIGYSVTEQAANK